MKKLFKKLSYSIVGAIGTFLMLPSKAYAQGTVIKFDNLDNLLWSIVKTVQYYTLPILAIALAFLGIRYATSTDEGAGKKQIEKQAIAIGIGALLVFGAATIAQIIKSAVGG
jgi:type IV secretory pathway VirB2 component (pilin)